MTSILPTTKPTAITANGFIAIPAALQVINAHIFLANWAVFQETRPSHSRTSATLDCTI